MGRIGRRRGQPIVAFRPKAARAADFGHPLPAGLPGRQPATLWQDRLFRKLRLGVILAGRPSPFPSPLGSPARGGFSPPWWFLGALFAAAPVIRRCPFGSRNLTWSACPRNRWYGADSDVVMSLNLRRRSSAAIPRRVVSTRHVPASWSIVIAVSYRNRLGIVSSLCRV